MSISLYVNLNYIHVCEPQNFPPRFCNALARKHCFFFIIIMIHNLYTASLIIIAAVLVEH